MEIADHHVVCKSPKIKCIKRPLVKLRKNINVTHFLISPNSTIAPMSALDYTFFKFTTPIHRHDNLFLTHSLDQLESYTLFEIFSDVHDAMQELKDLQMDSEDGDMLLEIWRGLGATLESVAQGGSSIISAIDVVIHNTLNGVGDLDEKVVGEATSQVIESTEHTFKNSTMGIGNMFCGILGVIGGMV